MGNYFSKPLPYTSDPVILLASELVLFVQTSTPTPWNALGLPSIVWPLWPWGSGSLDEIYPLSIGNIWATAVHAVLFVLQIAFISAVPLSGIIGVPFLPLLCTPAFMACFIGFILLNQVVCLLLNGWPGKIFYAAGPKGKFSEDVQDPEKRLISSNRDHDGERWVFINGVAVGSHWLQSNLDRLAATFRRPILGIHNDTYGIVFDVIECIIQRTFGYPTLDIRTAYAEISKILADDATTKLVLIAHSQGSIEAGMVLDWLYATMSTVHIHKLEVYTFGNAANHWNSPMRLDGPAIKHVEHYANEWDWVSRFGILHFRPLALAAAKKQPAQPANGATVVGTVSVDNTGSKKTSVNRQSTADMEAKLAMPHRFWGRLFLRHASGHQFNQHYLDNIFPMDWKKKDPEVVNDPNMYLNQEYDLQALFDDNTVKPKSAGAEGDGSKIIEKSRLWLYVNGGVPPPDPVAPLNTFMSPVAVQNQGLL